MSDGAYNFDDSDTWQSSQSHFNLVHDNFSAIGTLGTDRICLLYTESQGG